MNELTSVYTENILRVIIKVDFQTLWKRSDVRFKFSFGMQVLHKRRILETSNENLT